MRLRMLSLVSLLLTAGCAALTAGRTTETTPPGGQDRPQERATGPKPYSQVITKEARSDEGVFTVHQIGEKVYYEIPADLFEVDFLWISRIAMAPTNMGYGGQKVAEHVIRWARRGEKVYLQDILYQVVADSSAAIFRAVQDATFPAVLAAFDVAAVRMDTIATGAVKEHVVIEVTDFVTGDVGEFSPRTRVNARRMDPRRSYLSYIKSFPENIEYEQAMTFEPTTGTDSISLVMHHSMLLLPAEPMMPRLNDDRLGYFSVARVDFGTEQQRAVTRRFITRWRLEKKDPGAAISEPVKPIVWYIDPATPEKWRPYIKQGIEDWNVAFEQAGFRNAVQCLYPPDDPDWDPEDARYAVIRYLPSTVENASGPHVHDPRTGEVLEADVQWYHNVMNLLRDWYFVQVGNLDPRAAHLPLPDDLMGQLIRYVACHEVGHSLGLQHNMKASSAYTVEQMRDAAFVRQNGHTPSIMDYARFNYVAQPGDGVGLIPIIGPYDKYVIEWGYKPIAGARSPEDEKAELNRIAVRQEENEWLRFGPSDGIDPSAQTEDLSSDPVAATTLGLKNIEAISKMLVSATTTDGEDYSDLGEVYGRLVGQRNQELRHVIALVGGVRRTVRHAGTPGFVFEPVTKAEQTGAVAFLNEQAFRVPAYLLDPEVLRRIEPAGVMDRILTAQRQILTGLYQPARVVRLIEQQALLGSDAYSLTELTRDVRAGIWSELRDRRLTIDPFRRNLQRAWLDLVDERLNGADTPNNDLKPILRGEIRALDRDLVNAYGRVADDLTRLHIDDVRARIQKILNPNAL